MSVSRKSTSHLLITLVTDAVLVCLFAVVGYYTHAQNLEFSGIVRTAWPFMAALAIAWLANAVWTAPLAPLRTGVGIWATTVLVGMIIRIILGEGTAGPFILVASGVNLFTLVGWRVLASQLAGRGAR